VIDPIRARRLLVRSSMMEVRQRQPVMVNQASSSRATESRIPNQAFAEKPSES